MDRHGTAVFECLFSLPFHVSVFSFFIPLHLFFFFNFKLKPFSLFLFHFMRVVADIPHPRYKIQIFLYNAKYLVKIELGQFEQTFKISESDVMGLEDVKLMVSEELLKNSLDRFLSMRTDWDQAFKQKD